MAQDPERCSFELDPEAWEREHEEVCFVDPGSDYDEKILTQNADGNVVWRCPHEALDNTDLCLFHLPRDSDAKPDASTVIDVFLEITNGEREALDGDSPRPAWFVGAEFESLDLHDVRVGDGRAIDLRHARVGSAEWDVDIVESEPLDLRGMHVRDRWKCRGVTFGGYVRFDGAEFDGRALFQEAEFRGDVWFQGTDVYGNAMFSGAEFGGDAWFRDAEFGGDARFDGAEFGGDARFSGATVRWNAGFYGAEFDGDAWFKGIELGGRGAAWFKEAEFREDAWFDGARFREDAWFDGARFREDAWFEGVEFGGDAWFEGVEFVEGATFSVKDSISPFQGDTKFSDVTANGPLRIVDEHSTRPGRPYTFLGEVDFSGADIPGAEFSGVSFRDEPTFENVSLIQADLSNSWFEEATFDGADLTRVDLSETSVAGADFDDALLPLGSLYGTDLTNAGLYGARIEGVHVSDHTDFGIRNQIGRQRSSPLPFHGPWPDVRYDPRNPEYRRNTDDENDTAISDLTRAAAVYAEIERVAEANADSELASRCYLWRKDMQRKRYWTDEGRGNSRERFRWFRSMLANVFVRYGESPWRVTGIAGLLIVGCAVLYHLFDLIEYSSSPSQSALLSAVGTSAPDTAVTFLDALYFSTLTFSTLGMGTFQPSGQWGRLLAIFETLSGVVLLALLVFVFGRRATR